jgi:hypothetical protein
MGSCEEDMLRDWAVEKAREELRRKEMTELESIQDKLQDKIDATLEEMGKPRTMMIRRIKKTPYNEHA